MKLKCVVKLRPNRFQYKIEQLFWILDDSTNSSHSAHRLTNQNQRGNKTVCPKMERKKTSERFKYWFAAGVRHWNDHHSFPNAHMYMLECFMHMHMVHQMPVSDTRYTISFSINVKMICKWHFYEVIKIRIGYQYAKCEMANERRWRWRWRQSSFMQPFTHLENVIWMYEMGLWRPLPLNTSNNFRHYYYYSLKPKQSKSTANNKDIYTIWHIGVAMYFKFRFKFTGRWTFSPSLLLPGISFLPFYLSKGNKKDENSLFFFFLIQSRVSMVTDKPSI